MTGDPLASFETWALDKVNAPAYQPTSTAWVPTPTHRWGKSTLGGPMRCQDCGVRIGDEDEGACGEPAPPPPPAFTHERWCSITDGGRCDCQVPTFRWQP